jgi:hypothetical protein
VGPKRSALIAAVSGLIVLAPSPSPVDAAPPAAHSKASRPLEFDHVLIHVAAGAPERGALTRAGFTIAPDVNEHEGQGSTSITVELANGFLELVWRDTSVSVAPNLQMVARRFERQSHWRSSGWSPFSVGLRRGREAPDSLPFPTRAVRSPWMEPGASLEIISAANDTVGPRLFVVPRSMAANGVPESESERRRLEKRDTFVHANGARAITAVTVFVPDRALTPEVERATPYAPVVFRRGPEWRIELTFDQGRRGVMRDLRPELPVVCRF